jgi:hypothetical protein
MSNLIDDEFNDFEYNENDTDIVYDDELITEDDYNY